jgi:Tfp pilus assembly protein PilO
MAVLPQDRRGQIFLFLTIFAVATLWFAWSGTPIGGLLGAKALADSANMLQLKLDTVQAEVTDAKQTLATGALPELERRLIEYQRTLGLMRQLVPVSTEIPDLLDDIVSRARMRGAEVANFVPSNPPESGSPFDTQRARFTVTGEYDQIGEFISDVASLPRIIVPYDVRIERIANRPGADTSANRANKLVLVFQIRTYVKSADTTVVAAPPAPASP